MSSLPYKNTSKLVMCFLATVCMLLFSISAMAVTLPVNKMTGDTLSLPHAEFYFIEDAERSHTFESVLNLADESWSKTEGGDASFGFTSSQFWLGLSVNNNAPETRNFILEIAYPLLDDVSIYSQTNGGQIKQLDIGDDQPFYPRDVDHPGVLFQFQLDANESTNLYARILTKGSMILPVKIWQEDEFYERAAREQKLHFFYYGALAVILLINLTIAFTLREKLYLFYALSTTGYLAFFITSRGFGHQLLLPDSPALNTQLFLTSMPILALFSLLFAREFLQTKSHSPRMDLALRAMIYFEYFNLFASLFFDYNTAVKISAVSVFVFFIVLFCAGPVTWLAKRRSGAFFTIAWLPLTLGCVATGGRSSGLFPNNFFTEYGMQIGSGLEAFILTLALADRLYREREDKIRAQASSIQKDKQRLAAQNQLSEAMMRDPITKLSNGNRFEWFVNKTIRENKDSRFIVCVAKVSRFSEITRTLGLNSVESILRAIADRTNSSARNLPGIVSLESSQQKIDSTFQLTGDTFAVLINQNVSQNSIADYKSFIKENSQPIEINSLSIELVPRLGCALYPLHGTDASQLIRNAIVGMESSHHAPDQIGFYDQSLDIYSESRLTLMSDLKAALDKDEPTLHYQPKMNLSNNQIIGIEALIRWIHPKRGFVPPDEFISLAEETGVIKKLTLWAIERATKDLSVLQEQGYGGNVSINISTKDLLSQQLASHITSVIEKYNVNTSNICLELTETAAMDEPEASLNALNDLTALGLRISIDDFGTGYSSLSYLKRLPASEIKLDRSLIIDIKENKESALIIKASIEMAHGLGCTVVAEGIEDAETANILSELNCDMVQGYWLCKPKPLLELIDWLSARQAN